MNAFYRVYANLSVSPTLSLTDTELVETLAYNRRYRPGGAQIVNGRCVYRGYLSTEEARTIDPTIGDDVPGVTVAEAVAILNGAQDVPIPAKETPSGGLRLEAKGVRGLLGRP